MPPWIGPVTIGLGTVGLSTSRCEPAAGPLPFGLESASALTAVMSPIASAAPTMARGTPPDARPVIASPSSAAHSRRQAGTTSQIFDSLLGGCRYLCAAEDAPR